MHWSKVLIFTILIFLFSCSSGIKIIYGIKDPKTENESSITEYMKKNKMITDNVFVPDENTYKSITQKTGLPDFFVFDNRGKLIIIESDKKCPATGTEFLEKLNPANDYNTNDEINLSEVIENLHYLNGNLAELTVSGNYDFFLVIYWAKFIGKLNQKYVTVWENTAHSNNFAKIKTFKINMDPQKFWDL